MRKINVCLLKRKRRWVFPLVCLRWQCHSGLCSSQFCGPKGWSWKSLLAGILHIPSPSYQTQQHHSHQGTALGRNCRMKSPTPSFKLWNTVQWESKWPPVTPMGKTEGLPWKRGSIPWMTVSSLLPVLKPHPTALYRLSMEPSLKYFVRGCGWGRLKESDEICPSMNELGQGWGFPRIRNHGMWHQSHCERGNNKTRTSDMATCITSVNNQHFYCIWECYNVSN